MRRSAILAVTFLLLLGGCREEATSTSTATAVSASNAALDPEQLGRLGAQVKKQPNEASALLKSHGLDERSFEEAIRRVTEDRESSRRYAAAFRAEEGKS